jgi:hypothetical protein
MIINTGHFSGVKAQAVEKERERMGILILAGEGYERAR